MNELRKPGKTQPGIQDLQRVALWQTYTEFYPSGLFSRVINEATQPPYRQHCPNVVPALKI